MFIKSIFKEIFKKKFSNILIIIQVVITILLLVYSYDSIKMLNYPQEQLKSILDNNYKDIYKIKISNSSDSEEFANMFNKFDSELIKTLGNNEVGALDLTNTQYQELENNEKFMNLRRMLTKGTFKEVYPNAIELYKVDYSIYKLMNIKIESGRDLKSDDFENKDNFIIPMIVSNVYKGVINIDDVLTGRVDDRKYKVVGFFNENLSWLDEKAPVSNNLIKLNDKIIIPYIMDNSGIEAAIKAQAYYYINNDHLPSNVIKNNITALGKQFNLNVDCKSLEEQLSEITNKNKESIFYGMFISTFVVIISCFGLSIIMYYSVNIRKRELGIRIMCGGSMNYIRLLIVGEIITIMVVSFLITSLILINFRKVNSVATNVVNLYDIKTTLVIFIFIILFTIVTSLSPLIRIRKLNPKELIGGIE